ncbi:hypothetical protein L1887_34442 [Cichorium endivia]|nr:hypothetical protein L1887_34442 [Cichorium endivia]
MSRVRCILCGLELKTLVFLFVLVPTVILGLYVYVQRISYFLHLLWESPPKPFHEIPHSIDGELASFQGVFLMQSYSATKYLKLRISDFEHPYLVVHLNRCLDIVKTPVAAAFTRRSKDYVNSQKAPGCNSVEADYAEGSGDRSLQTKATINDGE